MYRSQLEIAPLIYHYLTSIFLIALPIAICDKLISKKKTLVHTLAGSQIFR